MFNRVNNNHSKENALFDLLTIIGNEISSETLARLKILLRGHVDKEVLDYVDSGPDLLLILNKRGLVTNGRLAFLRKLLSETKCFRLLTYLDSYKDKSLTRPWTVDQGYIEAYRHYSGKQRRLHEIIERIENEIKLLEGDEEKLKEKLEQLEKEIMSSKVNISNYEEEILKIKCNLRKEQLTSQSVEKRLDDIKYLIRKLYREEESLKEKLESTKLKKPIQDELIAKYAEIKGNQLTEGELVKKYENISTNIRIHYEDFRHQTSEMMATEKKLLEDTSQIRNLKKEIAKNVISSNQLRETLQNVTQEFEEFKYSTPFTPGTSPRNSRMKTNTLRMVSKPPGDLHHGTHETHLNSSTQMVDYHQLIERTQPVVIGRKGKKSNPPNFMCPCSIAIDEDDHIYIADTRNHRVQILHLDGSPARKPIEFGKFQPTAVAVCRNGKCFISDSYVVRVYSSLGELLYHILPVYGKADLRPKITSLAITNDDAILIVDTANKRVQKFRQDGIFLSFVGGNHVFHSPFGIAVAKNGDIIISDAHQIKIFEGENGPLKRQFGTKGMGQGRFWHPCGITMDNEDKIIVADSGNHQIQVLSVRDEEEASFGSLGTTPGFFDTPYDVAVTKDGKKVVVVEVRNHRVQVFTRAIPDDYLMRNSQINTILEDTSSDEIDKDNVKSLNGKVLPSEDEDRTCTRSEAKKEEENLMALPVIDY